MADAMLQCVNGFWFCPNGFIFCSMKGNLKRHMKESHKDNSCGEWIDQNPKKLMLFEANKTVLDDSSCLSDEDSVSLEL